MQPALHQHASTAERNCLVNLRADLIDRPHISIGRTGPSIERAEGAHNVADVRVVNVAINYVSDNVVRMASPANLISGCADSRHVVRLEQRRTIFGGQPVTPE